MEVDPKFAHDPTTLQDVYIPIHASTLTTAGSSARDWARPSAQHASAAASSSAGATANEATAPPGRNASSGAAVATAVETAVPLASIASWKDEATATAINHQDASAATTISFNLAEGKSLSDATADIHAAEANIHMPTTIHGSFQGTAKTMVPGDAQARAGSDPVRHSLRLYRARHPI